tara:strand:- start:213 stop:1235 length:1023 start_codon:yes stop_codon:yes gene_type:complete
MKFEKIKILRYAQKLKNQQNNFKYNYDIREGFIIKLYMQGFCGHGEAAPLPFFSNENLKEVEWAFEELKASLSNELKYDKDELLNLFELFTSKTPSLNFALDIALYDILSQIKNISLSKYLDNNSKEALKFSDLYFKGIDQINNVIKIKLTKGNFLEDLKFFKEASSKLNPGTIFRIDCNRSYNLESAVALCSELAKYNIEYIEEPLQDPSLNSIKQFKKEVQIPLAIDESIIDGSYKQIVNEGLIDFAILKPSLYGSIKKINEFKFFLDIRNIKLIFSSALETEIGNMACVHIGAVLGENLNHGLNNYCFYDYKKLNIYSKKDIKVNLNKIIGLGVSYD